MMKVAEFMSPRDGYRFERNMTAELSKHEDSKEAMCAVPDAYGLGGSRMVIVLLLLALHVAGCSPASPAMSADSAAPASTKIASSLRDVIQRLHTGGVTASNAMARHPASYSTMLVRVDTAGRLQVVLRVTAVDTVVTTQLVHQQMQIERVDTARHLIQGWIFFERLATIATLPFVRYISPPSYAARRSS